MDAYPGLESTFYAVVGSLTFLVSDTVLAYNRFVAPVPFGNVSNKFITSYRMTLVELVCLILRTSYCFDHLFLIIGVHREFCIRNYKVENRMGLRFLCNAPKGAVLCSNIVVTCSAHDL